MSELDPNVVARRTAYLAGILQFPVSMLPSIRLVTVHEKDAAEWRKDRLLATGAEPWEWSIEVNFFEGSERLRVELDGAALCDIAIVNYVQEGHSAEEELQNLAAAILWSAIRAKWRDYGHPDYDVDVALAASADD